MKTASKILEEKGYEADEVDSILTWPTKDPDSLDMQTRKEFGFESQPVHLWEAYYIGEADKEIMNKIAKDRGFDHYKELLKAATNHINSLAESYPSKK